MHGQGVRQFGRSVVPLVSIGQFVDLSICLRTGSRSPFGGSRESDQPSALFPYSAERRAHGVQETALCAMRHALCALGWDRGWHFL